MTLAHNLVDKMHVRWMSAITYSWCWGSQVHGSLNYYAYLCTHVEIVKSYRNCWFDLLTIWQEWRRQGSFWDSRPLEWMNKPPKSRFLWTWVYSEQAMSPDRRLLLTTWHYQRSKWWDKRCTRFVIINKLNWINDQLERCMCSSGSNALPPSKPMSCSLFQRVSSHPNQIAISVFFCVSVTDSRWEKKILSTGWGKNRYPILNLYIFWMPAGIRLVLLKYDR